MLVGSVVRNEIQNELHSASVHFAQQRVELIERTEHRRDIAVLRYVVAKVLHGRRIDRRDPNGVYTEPREVIQAFTDSVQVSFAVAVAVLERQGVDLVNYTALPPQQVGTRRWRLFRFSHDVFRRSDLG